MLKKKMEVLIVTGQSGAGKTQASTILEDLGYYCIDNIPIQLIPKFVKMGHTDSELYEKVALVVDTRGTHTFDGFFEMLELIRAMDSECKILFMESSDDTIIRRYKESRRRHPMQRDGESIENAINNETKTLQPIRDRADYVFNTSDLSLNALRSRLSSVVEKKGFGLVVSITAFGYKYGLPKDIDMLFDARFLPNPFYIPDLRPLTGVDLPIREFLSKTPQMNEFITMLNAMIDFMTAHCAAEGRSSLSIGIGCTGGRHRSVAVAAALSEHMEAGGCRVAVSHRDIEK